MLAGGEPNQGVLKHEPFVAQQKALACVLLAGVLFSSVLIMAGGRADGFHRNCRRSRCLLGCVVLHLHAAGMPSSLVVVLKGEHCKIVFSCIWC
jgi:hypothetical protein